MSYQRENPYQSFGTPAWAAVMAEESERTAFIRRTYAHLAAAVAAFAALETLIFVMLPEAVLQNTLRVMIGTPFGWLLVLGAFCVVSWIAQSWAVSATSLGKQYLGLGLYVVAEAVIFVPLIYFAQLRAPGAISAAALTTGVIFGGLTLMVFVTRADFSWLGRFLWLGAMAALALIVCSLFIGVHIGIWFAVGMIVLASGYILYYTSNVLHHFRTTQHVAAALALFASVALLFWYVLQIMASRR